MSTTPAPDSAPAKSPLIAVLAETHPAERRVAASPESVGKLIKLGFSVAVEAGAGDAACYPDTAFAAAGARIEPDARVLLQTADVLLKVRPPHQRQTFHEADEVRPGAVWISFLWPAREKALIDRLAARKVSALAMDAVPRISRAQKMDALSSMANIAGYRAVILAANHFGSFFTGQMTAAGKVAPAKVLVIGAGVAGLAALGAAKGLGAIVRAFDTRSAVRDQVKSMGAEFLEVNIQEEGEGKGGYAKEMSPAFIAAEMALFREQAREVDVVITTALIPGKPAPKLWLQDMVEAMKPGSVIVDLAAEAGGNCDVTLADQVVHHPIPGGAGTVTVLGPTDLPSQLATTASQLYANNLVHLLSDMGGGAKFRIDLEDEVVRGALVLHDGQWTWPPPAKPAPAPAPVVEAVPAAAAKPMREPTMQFTKETVSGGHGHGHGAKPQPGGAVSARKAPLTWVMLGVLVVAWIALHFFAAHQSDSASHATALFAERLTVFVLACFVGWQVIWNVTPALHTPLMSVTNAISGIIIVGGMLHTAGNLAKPSVLLGIVAVLLATINISGGFLVTRRMLKMFRK